MFLSLFHERLATYWRAKSKRDVNLQAILDSIETDEDGNLLIPVPKEGE